jgi:DNA-binding NtrC family response regulator
VNCRVQSPRGHRQTLERVESAAANDAEVLITGPSGVGKELYAHAIHQKSRRAGCPFIAVNCGALPPELFENELFGHVGGAFTGARPKQGGLVQAAERGTLFFDEVDALHVANQVKLLRLLQEKEYRPLGEARARKVDVRFIAATNAELSKLAMGGGFRQDLFFRLRVIPIEVPPLRQRSEDVVPLFEHFVDRYTKDYQAPAPLLSEAAADRLAHYGWPGNVRELENLVRFLVCNFGGRPVDAGDLPLLADAESPEPLPKTFQSAKRQVVSAFERRFLEETLQRHGGNIAAAARESGKHRRAFFELMRRHGLAARRTTLLPPPSSNS